jgi:serine/threonine protein kinase
VLKRYDPPVESPHPPPTAAAPASTCSIEISIAPQSAPTAAAWLALWTSPWLPAPVTSSFFCPGNTSSTAPNPFPPFRFFNSVEDFERESAIYNDHDLRRVLPAIMHATTNLNGAVASPSGYHFPPFLVIERGTSLGDWMQEERSFGAVLNMLDEISRLLAVLHGAGRVHRDLKPGNVLLLLQTQVWRLIDFGISASTGAPQCGCPMNFKERSDQLPGGLVCTLNGTSTRCDAR